MTLEDFFTLTEMKNGLTTCARVEELICVMQKQNCITNNVGDAARQWSTVASTLASTQNRECLNHFVHLNGFGFINHWLQVAVKYSRDVADDDELINTLLGSLDKLPMNPEKLSASGISATVENLFGHKNVNIKERAQILFDKWNHRRANDDGCQEMVKVSSCPIDTLKPSSDTVSIEVQHTVEEDAGNSFFQTADEESCKVESGRIQNLQVICDNDIQLGDANNVNGSTPTQTSPVCSNDNEKHLLPPTTSLPDSGQEIFFVQEGSFIPSAGMDFSAEDNPCNTSASNDINAELKKGKGDSWEFRETSSIVPSASGLTMTSLTKKPTVIRSASCNLTLKETKETTLHRCASVDGIWAEYSKTTKEANSGEHAFADILDLSPSKGNSWRKEDAEYTSDVEHYNGPTLKACKVVDTLIYDDTCNTSNVQVPREIKKSLDSDPESGEMDALEIARLVAIEVERQVVDYREELCSSSPEVSSNEIMNTASPSIEEDNRNHLILLGEENGNDSVAIKDVCENTSGCQNEDTLIEMATVPAKQEQSLESPNGGAAAVIQESRARAEMGKFDFDLNEEACIEDIDSAVNPIYQTNVVSLSAPIAVSASKGAPPGFLITPLCFESGLGWRGSAATSAFRPASPRRTLDAENTEFGTKYKANLIQLDLNVADSESYYLPVDTCAIKDVPVSSGMPSWNSSSEVSSLRTDRVKLDLNSNGEVEATPYHSSLINHHFLNRDQRSPPPASSSSSSLRRPSRKTFDLNDNLFLSDAAAVSSKNIKAGNTFGVKIDDPVITIMGSRMSVERRGHSHQSYMGNGSSFDATMLTRPMLPYAAHQIPHPNYGYMRQGIGVAAAAAALPFQPAVYGLGNMPHMVDSRGATVVPQVLSTAGVNCAAPLATSPFLMSITSTPSSSNGGGGTSQPGLDLNFGMMQMESSGHREVGNLKHPLFLPGHTAGLMEEQIRTASQQDATSGNPLKRKEPDCGFPPYGFGYKHVTSWH